MTLEDNTAAHPPAEDGPAGRAPRHELPWRGISLDELQRIARRRVPPPMVDDVVQEFVCRRLQDDERRRVTASYADTALRWIHLSWVRRSKRQQEAYRRLPDARAEEQDVLDGWIEREGEERVHQLLEAMEAEGEAGQLLRLRYFELLSVKELAVRLRRPERSIENHLARALAQMRRRYERKHARLRRAWSALLVLLPSRQAGSGARGLRRLAWGAGVGVVTLATVALLPWSWQQPSALHAFGPGPEAVLQAANELAPTVGGTPEPDLRTGTLAPDPGGSAAPRSPWPPGFEPTGVELRVRDQACAPVAGFDLWVQPGRAKWSGHPGRLAPADVIHVEGSDARLELPPHLAGEPVVLFLSTPDHAWTRREVEPGRAGPVTVRLEPACSLEVQLGGEAVGSDWVLFLVGEGAVPLLRQALDPHGPTSLVFDRLPPAVTTLQVLRRDVQPAAWDGLPWLDAVDVPCSSAVPVVLEPGRVAHAALQLGNNEPPAARVSTPVLVRGALPLHELDQLTWRAFPQAPGRTGGGAQVLSLAAGVGSVELFPGPYVFELPELGFVSGIHHVDGTPLTLDLPPILELEFELPGSGEDGAYLVPDGPARSGWQAVAVQRTDAGRARVRCVAGRYRLYRGFEDTSGWRVEFSADGVQVGEALPPRWPLVLSIALVDPDGTPIPMPDSVEVVVDGMDEPGVEVSGIHAPNRPGLRPLFFAPAARELVLRASGPTSAQVRSFVVPGYLPTLPMLVRFQEASATQVLVLRPECP